MSEEAPEPMAPEDVGMGFASIALALVAALHKQGVDGKRLLKDFEDELDELLAPMEGTPAGQAVAVCISALVWSDPDGPAGGEPN